MLFYASFGDIKGRWQKGGDDKTSWIDFVIYSGSEKDFDLSSMDNAALGFAFNLEKANKNDKSEKVTLSKNNGILTSQWKGLSVSIPLKPAKQPGNL